MKKKDALWLLCVCAFLALLVAPLTAPYYRAINASLPYVAGFVKFAVLATLGDLLSVRILRRGWTKISGIGWRALVYGFIGMLITLVMGLFSGGVTAAQGAGLLPFAGSSFATAFFTSAAMNLFFGPTFMGFHRVSDTFIDLCYSLSRRPTASEVISAIDWHGFLTFVVAKTIPIFWIPVHTLVFLLPGEYRVLAAAVLSILMGAILSFAKSKKAS